MPALYNIYNNPTQYANDFHDITSGSNGYSAGNGYDLVTGVGSPKANNLVPDLAGVITTSSLFVTGSTPADGAAHFRSAAELYRHVLASRRPDEPPAERSDGQLDPGQPGDAEP